MWESPVPRSPRGHSRNPQYGYYKRQILAQQKEEHRAISIRVKMYLLQEEFKQRLHDHLAKTS